MKKAIKILSVFLLIAFVALSAYGCKKGIVSGETYYLCVYDAGTDRFVRRGASLRFGDGLTTFEYCLGEGDLTITGSVEQTQNPNTRILSCNEEMISLVNERYRKSLIESGVEQSSLELYDALAANFTARSQYFIYEDTLFAGSSVELFRTPDADSDSFEGIYRLDSEDTMIRLRGGYMYEADGNGEYTRKSGRYTAARGILTLTSMNADGSDRYENGILYQKRYLMAKITIPESDTLLGTSLEEQMESSKFIKKITADLSAYSGKTICVLSEQFFSKDLT